MTAENQVFTVPFTFKSHDKKSQVNAKLWTNTAFGSNEGEATEKPKAIIQIVHGMSEYIDRYDELAEYFVSRGFVVCAEDHIGHGKTMSSYEERGCMPIKGGKDILLADVRMLYGMVSNCFPNIPYVLYGHSMGSFIARAYIARHGRELAACVLSGTGNVPAKMSKAGRTLAGILSGIRGENYRSKLIDNMGAGAYGKQIPDARTPLDWLSTDPAVVDAYMADPLCGFMFSVGGYATLLDLTAEVVTPECAAKVPKTLPILLAAGDGDPVGDMGKGVHAAAELLRAAGVETVDEKIYEGMRHEIHNEIGKEQVYDDLATWIEHAVAIGEAPVKMIGLLQPRALEDSEEAAETEEPAEPVEAEEPEATTEPEEAEPEPEPAEPEPAEPEHAEPEPEPAEPEPAESEPEDTPEE